MGLGLERERFEAADYERFSARLQQGLEALGELLARPGFGEGPPSLGAELELFLIDAAGRPLPLNRAVLRQTFDPRLTVELDRFNLECNLRPSPLAGPPFSALRREIVGALDEWHQTTTPGRQGADPWDWLADVAGAALGIALARAAFRRDRDGLAAPPRGGKATPDG